ncbi:MAG TPA: DUF1415 family protein [Polyangia bacterium]|jgi:hypothetical protein|nr:DUF1415 family protein [Polyangia bacterium]
MTDGGGDDPATPRVSEALRLHDRYLREVVLAYGLCPWAEKVLREGRFRRAVLDGATVAPAAFLAFIDALEAEPAPVEVAFAIFPSLDLPSAGFDKFAEQLRRADRARRSSAAATPFLLAAFHPSGADEFQDRNQLIAFLRRSPDATVQLVRADVLDRVRGRGADVSDGVARQNFATVSARGVARLGAVLADLRRDRDESYRRLAPAR